MKLEISEDLKDWYALSCPLAGLRFDARTLALLDADGDGRIRADELRAALAFLAAKGVAVADLFGDHAADEAALADNLAQQADLAKVEPSAAEKAAYADWEAKGRDPSVAVCGDARIPEERLHTVEAGVWISVVSPDDCRTPFAWLHILYMLDERDYYVAPLLRRKGFEYPVVCTEGENAGI